MLLELQHRLVCTYASALHVGGMCITHGGMDSKQPTTVKLSAEMRRQKTGMQGAYSLYQFVQNYNKCMPHIHFRIRQQRI